MITGTNGDDVIIPGAGNSRIDGDAGNDLLVLAGSRASYSVLTANGQTFLIGARSAHEIRNVEAVQFADSLVTFSAAIAAARRFAPLDYVASHDDLIQTIGTDPTAALNHYVTTGFDAGRAVTFEPLSYIASHDILIAYLGADADAGARHYIEWGHANGYESTFDALGYIASYDILMSYLGADAAAGARHYIEWGRDNGYKVTFRGLDYIASHDILMDHLGLDADAGTQHYIEWGRLNGYAPTFNGLEYIASHDILMSYLGADAEAGAEHYITWGRFNGYSDTFSGLEYIASHGILIANLGYDADAGAKHYIEWGRFNGYTSTFDPVAYLLTNPGLASSAEQALRHWITVGYAAGLPSGNEYGHEQATHEFINGTITGAIDSPGDRDWYAVEVKGGVPLRIALGGIVTGEGTLHGGEISLHDEKGNLLVRGSAFYQTRESDSWWIYTPSTDGTFYVSVTAPPGNQGTYTLSAQPFLLTTVQAAQLGPGSIVQGTEEAFDEVHITNASGSYGGFNFSDIERLRVSGNAATLDLANSGEIERLTLMGGPVTFTNVGSLAAIEYHTVAQKDVTVGYRNDVLAGTDDTVSVTVASKPAGIITLGSMSDPTARIETLRLSTTYVFHMDDTAGARITELRADITRLEIGGAGGLSIAQALRPTVREVAVLLDPNPSAVTQNVSLDLRNASGGITYTGSSAASYVGSNIVILGNFSDVLTTFAGNDIITAGAGDDIISTGGGDDRIIMSGNLTAADQVDGGTGNNTLVLGNKNYTDADLVGFSNISTLETADFFSVTIGAHAQAIGIRTVVQASASGSLIDASAYTVGIIVNASAGGSDTIRTGAGDDLVTFNGDVTLDLGAGFDIARGSGTINLDNALGVERFEGGSLTFTGANLASPATVTVVADNITLGAGLTDADYDFAITGTTLIKQNVGVANLITFNGTGADILQVNAADLGPNLNFNAGAGLDQLVISGGILVDSQFSNLHEVERLANATGVGLNATMGAVAAAAGITHVVLTSGNHQLTVDNGFVAPLAITSTGTGTIHIDAGATESPIDVLVPIFGVEDTVIGSASTLDVLTVGGVNNNLSGVSFVERIVVSVATGDSPEVKGTITLDTAAGELSGTGPQVVQINEYTRQTSMSRSFGTVDVDASLASADIAVRGGHRIVTGSGNDQIRFSTLAETFSFTTTGWDVIAGAGNDRVLGNRFKNVIDGGSGADQLYGGLHQDTLTGGADADIFIYTRFAESNGAAAQGQPSVFMRDTIADFVSGMDQIDVTRIFDQPQLTGDSIVFAGNAADLAAAQALLTPLDDTLDAVFQQDTNTLWFDNGDGMLDATDLQIVLTGVSSLVAADVMAGAVITPDPTFVDTFVL